MTIAIIPAGGKATRIHALPKYLLPTPHGTLLDVLLRRMIAVSPRETVIMTKGFNITILQHYALPNVLIADRDDTSMTHAVMLARDYTLANESVIFGMPDTYFDDADAFSKLVAALDDGADVAVGVFRIHAQQKRGGMCRIEGQRVVEVVDKPEYTDLTYIWGVLAWRPSFWSCLRADEPHVGYGLPRAIAVGLDVRVVVMDGHYFDAGTVSEYYALINHLTREAVGV